MGVLLSRWGICTTSACTEKLFSVPGNNPCLLHGNVQENRATDVPASLVMLALLQMDICEVSSSTAGTLG